MVYYRLHHIVHCTEKMRLCVGSVSVERVVQGEVGGVTAECCAHGSYLDLAVKRPLLAPGGSILKLAA